MKEHQMVYMYIHFKLTLAIKGTTPAYFAAQEGKLEVLQYLHETAKCDLSISSGEAADNLKPIHAAAQGGHTNIIKVLY